MTERSDDEKRERAKQATRNNRSRPKCWRLLFIIPPQPGVNKGKEALNKL